MACQMVIYDTEAKTKQKVTCDEDNTTRLVEDEHAAKGTGEYADTQGNTFRADWTRQRLISFKREE